MVTLRDIAAKCGLSVATVSKAMNNMPDISSATAQKVQQTAREMGYLPNSAARSMKTGRSMNVGLLLFLNEASVWTHNYFSMIAQSIHSRMEENGYDLAPVSAKCAMSMGSYSNYCHYRNYDGVIVMSGGYKEPTLMELVDSDIPLVTIDYEFNHRGAVTSDNYQGMHDLLHYVFSKGHRRIAFVHGEDTFVTQTRLASFYAVCEDLGLDIPESYVIKARYHDTAASASATRRLMEMSRPPTCILYPDDFAYLGGLKMLTEMGLSIPNDVSVAGYDGTYLAGLLTPSLCTFRQDCEAIGANAADMLLSAIAKPRTFIPKHIVLPGTLVEGASVVEIRPD